ncbi:nucleotidyltransferase domain-containing protein [Sulfolobus islandicus]|nr:nucleotidyltransferase domain-containing protein [Sulfolobus islandicus]
MEKLIKLLLEEFGDRLISVVVYGSVARGDNRKDSDVDVGYFLRKEKVRFPQWFQEKIDEFAYYSRVLKSERESAMYEDEETGATPEELYSKFDAENAIKMCESVHVSL